MDNGMSENKNRILWDAVRTPPDWALKEITAGKLKGKLDINPQWRWLAITENLGPCGFGWKYEIVKTWTEKVLEELMCFIEINFYTHDNTLGWSAPIPSIGGDYLIESDKNGIHGNDEAYKMALTDALGKAASMIGVAADIYQGSKYMRVNDKVVQQEKEKQENVDYPKRIDVLKKQLEIATSSGLAKHVIKFKEDLLTKLNKTFDELTEKEADEAIENLKVVAKTWKKEDNKNA